MKTLENPIKHCKSCFKELKKYDFYELVNEDSYLCPFCQQKLVPHFIKFDIDCIDALSIYEYDDNIKAFLYQLKGCHDVELAPIFLNPFKRELRLMYWGYTLVCAPSYCIDDENRGFKHVEKIFEILNLPICYPIEKVTPFKQAENSRRKRKQIIEHLRLVNPELIKDKKILIVDDVCTSGSTLKAMIKLAKDASPKAIKILVMSKREMH